VQQLAVGIPRPRRGGASGELGPGCGVHLRVREIGNERGLEMEMEMKRELEIKMEMELEKVGRTLITSIDHATIFLRVFFLFSE
jgi:hypothetical protein